MSCGPKRSIGKEGILSLIGYGGQNWLVWIEDHDQSKFKSHIVSGISPVSWLVLISKQVRLVIFAISKGISPVSWLLPRSIWVRFVKLPISKGISPVSWFPIPFRLKEIKLVYEKNLHSFGV